ncbi:hypothetical protein [Vulcanisaeta distributa]|uniref:hypothetical protein n=1 Tax=Vulcanisaeta distributa TaxID=164451 RepID=UPI0006D189F1|nr:hypothetical protein [Vulcanisaeta distributa]
MSGQFIRKALLIAVVILAALDGYAIYMYAFGSPLPYIGTLSLGPYQVAAASSSEAILYYEQSVPTRYGLITIIGVKGVNMVNGKTLWVTKIMSSSLAQPLITFSLVGSELFVITYEDHVQPPLIVTTINVTVINTLTGIITNSTTIAITPEIIIFNVVNNHVYVLEFPPSTNSMVITYYRLSNSPPYVTLSWNQTLTDVCGPYSTTGNIGIHEGTKYVLMTVPCNKTIHVYLLNRASGGGVVRSIFITSPSSVARIYGVINNTVIYLCGTRICGTNMVTNETWSIPIMGYLTSVTTYGDKAIVLMMNDNTLIMSTVAPNGTVLMDRAIWSYKPPWCARATPWRYTPSAPVQST